MTRATRQHSTPHHARGHTATEHAPQWARGAHQHSTPYHGGGHTPTQQTPPRGGPRTSTAPNLAKQTTQPRTQPDRRPQPTKNADRKEAKTTMNQQNKLRMAPAKTPPTRTQQRRSAGGTDDNPSLAPPHHAQPPRQAGTNTARPTMRGATHQHSTPNHEGGPTTTQHARP